MRERSLLVKVLVKVISKMGNSLAPRVVEEDTGDVDKSDRIELGLVNIDSHDSNTINWTDVLEIIMLIIMILGIVRVVIQCRKKRNAKKMARIATLMASTQPTAQQTHVQMTSLPVLRSARGPRELETVRAIQGPGSSEISSPISYEPWNE